VSVVLATKEAVFEALKARFAGTPVAVSWADPGKNARTQHVWFTETVEPDLTPRAMVAGRRKPTQLEAELTVRAVSQSPGDPVRAERSVYAIRDLIEKAVLDDIVPSAVSPELQDVRPLRSAITTGETGSGQPAAQCDFVLKIRAHIRS
jgi:hypothetical protein